MADPADKKGEKTGDGAEGAAETGNGGAAEKTLTQAEVDRIVEQRLARERNKFSDYDELKAKAAKADELEAAQLSDLEKERKAREKAEAERDELKGTVKKTTLRSSLLAEAAKPDRNIVDTEVAIELLLGKDSDLLVLDKDGNPTNVAEATDQLLERRTFLVGGPKKTTPSADQGARGGSPAGQVTEDELKNMKPEDIVKARKEGRLENVLSG